mmetsp:Transcript_29214/g.72944  ORF Transcript_29214/g.72944 Transcript_29214/m.72944 type:complete len:224 (+) Transcript_29214:980-1651(+)
MRRCRIPSQGCDARRGAAVHDACSGSRAVPAAHVEEARDGGAKRDGGISGVHVHHQRLQRGVVQQSLLGALPRVREGGHGSHGALLDLNVEGLEERAQRHERAAVDDGGSVRRFLGRQGLQRASARNNNTAVFVAQGGDQILQDFRGGELITGALGAGRQCLQCIQGGHLNARHHVLHERVVQHWEEVPLKERDVNAGVALGQKLVHGVYELRLGLLELHQSF